MLGLLGWLVGWLLGWLVGCLLGWLVGWLVGCLLGWLVGWLLGGLVGWLVGWLVNESILSRGSSLNTAPAKLCALVELGRYMADPGCSCSSYI